MKPTHRQHLLAAALTCVLTLLGLLSANAQQKPNIIFILADDLGNADLGYRGGEIKTPNIDALAKEGVRLESFYGMPVCTPARAALMTGRYPMRHGLQTLVIFPSHTYGLPTDERTLPQALKEAGYRTSMVGKWHLGHADRKYWPQNRGFDHFYGNVMGEVDYFTRERGGVIDWQRNGEVPQGGRLLHDPHRRRGRQADRSPGPAEAVLPLLRLAGARTRPIRRRRNTATSTPRSRTRSAATYAGDDHGARRPGRPHRRGARQEGSARQHDHPLRQRQRRRDERAVRQRRHARKRNARKAAASSRREAAGIQRRPPRRQGQPVRGRRARAGLRQLAGEAQARASSTSRCTWWTSCPRCWRWPGARAPPIIPSTARTSGRRWPRASRSPHEDILINVEAFRGAIRKGNWKLVKIAPSPGKTELFDLAPDPGEKTNVADQNPEVVARPARRACVAYAREQKPSEWIKAQPAFLGAQGKTVFDPDFDIDDGGLPHEKPVLPVK